MNIEHVKIEDLKPAKYNPRKLTDKQFEDIKASLSEFGFVDPIIINKDNTIIGGHQRVKVAGKIGKTEVPAIRLDLTNEKEKELNIRLNKNSGEWDWDILANEFEMEDLTDWGFSEEELLGTFETHFAPEETEGDDDVPESAPAITVKGDLYELGEHRLLCGDSTMIDDVEKLMNGQKAEILFTSPPYSDMREYNGGKELSTEKLKYFISNFHGLVNYQVINLGIKRDDNEIIPYWDDYIQHARECEYKLLSWNVWDKLLAGSIANQSAMFAIEHEWIFVFGKKVKKLNRIVEKSEESEKRLKSLRKDKNGNLIRQVRQADGSMKSSSKGENFESKNMPTVTQCVPQMGRDEFTVQHSAPFPIALCLQYIESMTNENDIVSEPFSGSGSTLIACEKTKRKCYGMELDEKYCDVIVKRYVDFCKKNGKPYSVKRNGAVCNEI